MAALISRATDSPSTISTNSWNRSARWAELTGSRRAGFTMAMAPAASQASAAAQTANRAWPGMASEPTHSDPPVPKNTR